MAATSSSYHLPNHICRTPPPSAALRSFFFRLPFNCFSSASTFTPLPPLNLLTASSRQQFSTRSVGASSSSPLDVRVEEEEEEEEEQFQDDEDETSGVGGTEVVKVVDRSKLPKLTIKEKKELASYAHSLGKKLKVQLVGKSGVTASLASSFVETLEANELLKIKIHATCPGEVTDVAKQLEDATSSVIVGQIGRTVILYRPSLSKMKAEEKRRQVRKVFVRKESVFKPAFPV